jgi:hypothetical protein
MKHCYKVHVVDAAAAALVKSTDSERHLTRFYSLSDATAEPAGSQDDADQLPINSQLQNQMMPVNSYVDSDGVNVAQSSGVSGVSDIQMLADARVNDETSYMSLIEHAEGDNSMSQFSTSINLEYNIAVEKCSAFVNGERLTGESVEYGGTANSDTTDKVTFSTDNIHTKLSGAESGNFCEGVVNELDVQPKPAVSGRIETPAKYNKSFTHETSRAKSIRSPRRKW